MLKAVTNLVNVSQITGVLPVVNGGTGVTTSTGTGNVVLSAAPTLSGDVSLSTGNLVMSTSGKGIDFSATSGAGTSELLNDYEEGTWTPTVSGVTLTIASGKYTKVGRTVFVEAFLRFPVTADTTDVEIAGLPFTPSNSGNVFSGAVVPANSIATMTKAFVATTGIQPNTAANARITNASFSGSDLQIGGWYSA